MRAGSPCTQAQGLSQGAGIRGSDRLHGEAGPALPGARRAVHRLAGRPQAAASVGHPPKGVAVVGDAALDLRTRACSWCSAADPGSALPLQPSHVQHVASSGSPGARRSLQRLAAAAKPRAAVKPVQTQGTHIQLASVMVLSGQGLQQSGLACPGRPQQQAHLARPAPTGAPSAPASAAAGPAVCAGIHLMTALPAAAAQHRMNNAGPKPSPHTSRLRSCPPGS